MWFVILASCVLMGPVLWVFVNRLQPMARPPPGEKKRKEEEEEDGPLSLKMCYWFVYGALLKQGFTSDPKSGKLTPSLFILYGR